MKKIVTLLVAILAMTASHAQNTYPWSSNGYIGIGTTSPLTQLDVKVATNQHIQFAPSVNGAVPGVPGIVSINDANSAYTQMGSYAAGYYFGGGNLGIGTSTPTALLDIGKTLTVGQLSAVLGRLSEGNNEGSGTYLGVRGYDTQLSATYPVLTNVKSFAIEHSFYGVTNSSISFLRGNSQTGGSISFSVNNNTEKMRITGDGNVGIGTSTPDAKLAVSGTVHAKEVKVDLNVPGPDYVFRSDYKLPQLKAINDYIKKNDHLPEIPSAKEMEKEGINLSEMNMLLLKKVEELTLHLINQDKRIRQLESKGTLLQDRSIPN